MINPWLGIPSTSPYVLPEDRAAVEAFNAKLLPDSPCRIDIERVIPEPFVGTVSIASVIVLQLNPGHDLMNDPVSHADPQFREALFANLRHEGRKWPFYFFDERFRDTHPGGIWWRNKTKKLAEVYPYDHLSGRVAVIEWFPYKSPRFKPGCVVPSQQYGFNLVSSAIKRGALIVVSRSVALWERSVPALQTYSRKLTLSSVQNVALTQNNLKMNGSKTPAAWRALIDALR